MPQAEFKNRILKEILPSLIGAEQLSRKEVLKKLEHAGHHFNPKTVDRELNAMVAEAALSKPSHGLYEVQSPEMDT